MKYFTISEMLHSDTAIARKIWNGANREQEENLTTLMDAIIKAKPSAAKGTYLKSVVLSSTMGPGVKFNTMKF